MTINTSKMIEALEAFSMEMETYNYKDKDYQEEDVLSFPRKVLIEGMMDKTYYLLHGNRKSGKTGSDVYASKAKYRFEEAVRMHGGGEIDTNALRVAMNESQSAASKNDVLSQLLSELQELYIGNEQRAGNLCPEEYIPYGAPKTGNLPEYEVELPKDVADALAAMSNPVAANNTKKKVA